MAGASVIIPSPAASARAALTGAALALLAAGFGWAAPSRNGWAAAALIGALALDGLGRAAGRKAARKAALDHAGAAPPAGPPSIVLASGAGSKVGAAVAAAAILAWPAWFPLIASALAGLIAIGGVARLALARIVMRLDAPQDGTGP